MAVRSRVWRGSVDTAFSAPSNRRLAFVPERAWTGGGRLGSDLSTATACMSAEDARFTFDTNLLVYSIDNTAGARHRRARECRPRRRMRMLADPADARRVLCRGNPKGDHAAGRGGHTSSRLARVVLDSDDLTGRGPSRSRRGRSGTCLILGRATGRHRRGSRLYRCINRGHVQRQCSERRQDPQPVSPRRES